MDKVCFWNYSDGDYPYMTQALVNSLKKHGVNYDFHVYGNNEVKGAYNHPLTMSAEQKKHYLFKFNILEFMVKNLPYDYFIFLDADSYCVNDVGDILKCFNNSPVHSFLESDCTNPLNKRKDWWGCSLDNYVNLMRDQGVISSKIYNVNAGFWGVHKNCAGQFYSLAMNFWKKAMEKGYTQFTEEPPLAYATHMLCGDVELHLQKNFYNTWCSDWIGNFKNTIPEYRDWIFEDYMTGDKVTVKPSIVHAMRSKEALIKLGKQQKGIIT